MIVERWPHGAVADAARIYSTCEVRASAPIDVTPPAERFHRAVDRDMPRSATHRIPAVI